MASDTYVRDSHVLGRSEVEWLFSGPPPMRLAMYVSHGTKARTHVVTPTGRCVPRVCCQLVSEARWDHLTGFWHLCVPEVSSQLVCWVCYCLSQALAALSSQGVFPRCVLNFGVRPAVSTWSAETEPAGVQEIRNRDAVPGKTVALYTDDSFEVGGGENGT